MFAHTIGLYFTKGFCELELCDVDRLCTSNFPNGVRHSGLSPDGLIVYRSFHETDPVTAD